MGVPFIKIGSGDVTNPIVMTSAAEMVAKPLVVSTGMCDMEDVRQVYQLVMIAVKTKKAGARELTGGKVASDSAQ